MQNKLFKKSFKVYFGDTDAAGVVYHARYIYWLEATRIDWLDSIGCSYKNYQKKKIGFMPVTITINYHKPLKFADEFDVYQEVKKINHASIIINSSFKIENTAYCSATVKLACINEQTWKPIPLPKDICDFKIKQ